MRWWVLGFDYEAVMERWEDARFAEALEQAWVRAGRPREAEAFVAATADQFAFRFWLNDAAAALLEGWEARLIGTSTERPEHARRVLPPT